MTNEDKWKEEFYTISAYSDKIKTKLQSIKHSLKKWKGALKENLDKHHLFFVPIKFYADTCSLCVKYRDYNTRISKEACVKCPIYIHTNKDCLRQFDIWQFKNNPKPMIKLLEKVLEAERKK